MSQENRVRANTRKSRWVKIATKKVTSDELSLAAFSILDIALVDSTGDSSCPECVRESRSNAPCLSRELRMREYEESPPSIYNCYLTKEALRVIGEFVETASKLHRDHVTEV